MSALAASNWLGSIELRCQYDAPPPVFYPHWVNSNAYNKQSQAEAFLAGIHLQSPHVQEPDFHLKSTSFISQSNGINQPIRYDSLPTNSGLRTDSSVPVTLTEPALLTAAGAIGTATTNESDRDHLISENELLDFKRNRSFVLPPSLSAALLESSSNELAHDLSAPVIHVAHSSGPPSGANRADWERYTLSKGLRGSRVTYRSPLAPIAVSSVIPFERDDDDNQTSRPSSAAARTHNLGPIGQEAKASKHGESYAYLLREASSVPPEVQNIDLIDDPTLLASAEFYNPNFLDDPSLTTGRHRVVINLPSFLSSVLGYVRNSELKAELNAAFHVRHPWFTAAGMSLSKIRRCKALMIDIGLTVDLELSTVASAYVYFERLCLLNAVTKSNRKLVAGACLLLAMKFNEGFPNQLHSKDKQFSQQFWSECDEKLGVRKSEITKQEFHVYLELNFDLTVRRPQLMPHLDTIAKQAERDLREEMNWVEEVG